MNVWDVYRYEDGKLTSPTPYTGNTTVEVGYIWINHMYPDRMDGYTNKVPITFTNGNATINFKTQMQLYDDHDTPDTPNTPGEAGGVQKTLSITGISGVSGQITVALVQMSNNNLNIVALNQVDFRSSVTVPLITGNNGVPFTGSGSFYIYLFFDVNNTPDILVDDTIYFYTGGGESPITYNITTAMTTIEFNKFRLQQQ
jgi:hypothetical protein